MLSHFRIARSAHLLMGLLLLVTLCGVAAAEQSQEGLPADLVIDDRATLSEQLTNMETLYAAAVADLPKGGILNGIRNMFGGGGEEKPIYMSVGTLAQKAAQMRGGLVEAEGIWEPREGGGVLRSAGYQIAVELAGDTQPQGFDGVGGPDGMPTSVIGRVETVDDEPVLRADGVKPSALVAGVRIGRIKELQEDWAGAAQAYEQVASAGVLSTRPMAAFALTRAGFISLKQLQDEKQARKHLSQAWQLYTRQHDGQPSYWIWLQTPDGAWEVKSAEKALEEPLDGLNSQLMGYRIVDLFVRIAGGSPALGVILLAVVLRLAIFPLTKKQLVSQKRMQAIQPQIKELQKEHATDKQKFQEEFWALCKENNCNPLGGCLPMLVQMPILIFLYRGIREYIVQFEGVSFLWVDNLASPDIPLLILYTLSMIAFQKLAAKSQPTADPQQQQQQQMMAYMMPLMFFFFFQSFPAAFILYWLGSNVIYFGEQALFMRGGPKDAIEAAEGAKKSGFATSMLDAAKRMGGKETEEEEESAASYAERRKQEKLKRRGRKGR